MGVEKAGKKQHNPLGDDLSEVVGLSKRGRSVPTDDSKPSAGRLRKVKVSKKGDRSSSRKKDSETNAKDEQLSSSDDEEDEVLDSKLSHRLLQVVADQQDELKSEEEDEDHQPGEEGLKVDADGYVEMDDVIEGILRDLSSGARLSPESLAAKKNQKEDKPDGKKSINLADIVMEKLNAHNDDPMNEQSQTGVPSKVEKVYQGVGEYLKRYKSGKIPKAFKIIPRLTNWEEILYITDPLAWSPQAMFEATKLFASNFNPKMAQRFYNLVLLPAVREDILAKKKLNYHYYEALKRAMFKPSAWFKGILLPMVMDGCSLREVVIIGSILAKVSVPMVHAAAALVRMCDIHPWDNALCYIIAVLIHKKYSLPNIVIDKLVNHLASFEDEGPLPVIWHKCLLALVQKYKYGFSEKQKSQIQHVLKIHNHHQIGTEIRRELFARSDMDILTEQSQRVLAA